VLGGPEAAPRGSPGFAAGVPRERGNPAAGSSGLSESSTTLVSTVLARSR